MTDTASLVTELSVEIDGTSAPEGFVQALVEVTVESSLHMADMAAMSLHDPALKWIDSSGISPGKAIRIFTKADSEGSKAHPIFDGEIVEIEPTFADGIHRLTVRAFDRLHRLSRGRSVRSFRDVTVSDVAKKLAAEAGLQCEMESTKEVHAYLLQRNQTNLEFLSQCASAVGYLMYVDGKTLTFKPPAQAPNPIELQWTATLREFRPRLTTIGQFNTVVSRGWDPEAKKEILSEVRRGEGMRDIGQKKPGAAVAKEAFRIEAGDIVFDAPIHTQPAADSAAHAAADLSEERFIEAEGACAGDPRIVAGTSVKIKSVGDQFSGTYFVTSAHHRFADDGYFTRFTISGRTPSSLLHLFRDDDSRRIPGSGLVIGIVTDNSDEEKGWGRVKVKYPWLSADHASDWARVVAVGGGAKRGIEFLPEVNDEVLIGFEMGDMRFPYVIGGLWNGKDAPPESNAALTSGGKVTRRVIRSRTGHTVTFDDSDGQGGITLQDKNGNKFQIESGSNKITIEARGDVSISATGQVEIKGSLIKLN